MEEVAFVCYDNIVVELKATEGISDQHIARVLNALKATKSKIGLLINFGTTRLQHKVKREKGKVKSEK